ncbi:MFS transporter [bacterium]|nr:MFS transporter [bacterium]
MAKKLRGARSLPFADVLSQEGAVVTSLGGLIARAPVAMVPIGLIAIGSGALGSYAVGGAAAGAFSIANAVGATLIGRAADEQGHRPTLIRATAVMLVAAAAITAVALAAPEAALLIAASALFGAATPNIGSIIRARWTAVVQSGPLRLRAMALESVNDEVNFLIGPPIASLLIVQGLLWGPIAAAALLSLVGLIAVLSQRKWEPALHAPDAAGMAGAIRENGLLIVSAAGIGSILGASQVLLLGYCAAIGAAAGIALALGLNSGASLVGAILIGAKSDWRWSAERRFAVAAVFFALVTIPTAFVEGYLPYLVVTTIAGFGIAPMFIQVNAVIAERAGGSARSGAFALIGGGVVFGISAGSAIGGVAIDAAGASDARLILIPLALLMVLPILLGAQRAEKRPTRSAKR